MVRPRIALAACLALAAVSLQGVTSATCWGTSCGPCIANATSVCYPYECVFPLLPNGTCTERSNVCACGTIYRDKSIDDGKPACCGDCPSNRTNPGKPVPPVCPSTPNALPNVQGGPRSLPAN